MIDPDETRRLVDEYADCIARREDASHWLAANRHAKRAYAAFARLRAFGDAGRDAMMRLLHHPRPDVRVEAARDLLRYRTKECLDVLRKEAVGEGSLAWVASQSIRRWEQGNWHFESDETEAVGLPQRESARQEDAGVGARDVAPGKDTSEINNTAVTWDRLATDFFGPNPGAGDRAAAAMVLAHGFIMDGGVLHAAEVLDEAQLEAAKAGYGYFGFDGVVNLLSRAKSLLDRPPSVREKGADLEVEVLPGVTLMYEEEDLGQFEEQLDIEYRRHVPDDRALEERFEHVIAARPSDFADL